MKIRRGKHLYFLNNLRNFNENFRKNVTYDKAEFMIHKRAGLHPLYRKHNFEKNSVG